MIRIALTFLILMASLSGCNPFFSTGNSAADPSTKPDADPVSISGLVRYQDRYYNQNGFIQQSTPMKLVRFADMALLDEQGDVVSVAAVSSTGEFRFENIVPGDYRLRVYARAQHQSGSVISIQTHQGLGYAVDQAITVDASQTVFNIDLLIADRVAGLFNMLDVYLSAFDFIWTVTAGTVIPDDLNVYWHWGEATGSFTCRADVNCPAGAGIYVLSDPYVSGDTDEFDDDVLLHEFMHHLEHSMAMLDSPGGAHSLQSLTLDLRLSWSEGLAGFFAVSVKSWLRDNDSQRLSIPLTLANDLTRFYIDTRGTGVSVSQDFTQADQLQYRYATNEVAVIASLIELQQALGYETIWQSFFSAMSFNTTADTLEAFWDGLLGLNSPSPTQLNEWQSILSARQIDYRLDSEESNQTISSSKPLTDQALSLYRNHYSTDTDWFQFPVVAGQGYSIETYDLRNGADTLIELYHADGTPVTDEFGNALINDDAFECELQPGGCSPLHNGSNFSSRIDFTAASDVTLYVKVVTSPWVYNDPQSYGYIGRYGSYKIRVTETF